MRSDTSVEGDHRMSIEGEFSNLKSAISLSVLRDRSIRKPSADRSTDNVTSIARLRRIE